MKKILLVSCFYWPLSAPGAFRLYAFSKYLPKFEYEPHILTIDWNNLNTEGEYRKLNSIDPEPPIDLCPVTRFYYKFPPLAQGMIWSRLQRYTARGLFPISWPFSLTKMFYDHIETLHKRHMFDVILLSVPRWPHLKAVHSVSEKYGLPWIIDYRDILGEYPISKSWKSPLSYISHLYAIWAINCHNRVARNANGALTVSEPLADKLQKQGINNVVVLHNGFDPDDFNQVKDKTHKIFRIVYAGHIREGYQNPKALLDAIELLYKAGKISKNDFALEFYGEEEKIIRPFLRDREINELVHICQRQSKTANNKILANSAILIHLSIRKTEGIMTSKLTQYLGAGRPILTVPGDKGVVDKFLISTGAGVSMDDPKEISKWILHHYQYWKKHKKYLSMNLIEGEVKKYTWFEEIKKLAALLDNIV